MFRAQQDFHIKRILLLTSNVPIERKREREKKEVKEIRVWADKDVISFRTFNLSARGKTK